jgi:hypothetical protein
MTQLLNDAKAVLLDPAKRREYDRLLAAHRGNSGERSKASDPSGPGSSTWSPSPPVSAMSGTSPSKRHLRYFALAITAVGLVLYFKGEGDRANEKNSKSLSSPAGSLSSSAIGPINGSNRDTSRGVDAPGPPAQARPTPVSVGSDLRPTLGQLPSTTARTAAAQRAAPDSTPARSFSSVRADSTVVQLPIRASGAASVLAEQTPVHTTTGASSRSNARDDPNPDGLDARDREMIRTACAPRVYSGPASYNECLASQISSAKASTRPNLDGVSDADREMIRTACAPRVYSGPASYNECLASQVRALKRPPNR